MMLTENASADFSGPPQNRQTLCRSPQLTKGLMQGQKTAQSFWVFLAESSFPPAKYLPVKSFALLELPQSEKSQGRVVAGIESQWMIFPQMPIRRLHGGLGHMRGRLIVAAPASRRRGPPSP
uniref:Uncharacterized protein n=1 Tax=Streptomyces sp. NBC_01401 TaxID=2903854 RepID=A0AAU3GZF8_9ACTN